MISRFNSPSICVIDDDKEECEAIFNVLAKSHVGWIHVEGKTIADLPLQPISGLRLVFADLHLAGNTGKTAASHAANVFMRVVSPTTVPIVVVIWSKHCSDKDVEPGLPEDSTPTQAQLFKDYILSDKTKYFGRIEFIELNKPQERDRPLLEQWVSGLKVEIENKLVGLKAIDALWTWEKIVRDAVEKLSCELSNIAAKSTRNGVGASEIDGKLEALFRVLAAAQGGPSCSKDTAGRHLVAVMAQTLADKIEHLESVSELNRHGEWISKKADLQSISEFTSKINEFLMTAEPVNGSVFYPGTVYKIMDLKTSENLLCADWESAIKRCTKCGDDAKKIAEWNSQVEKVLIEITQPCDFQQGLRKTSLLIGGLIIPIIDEKEMIKTNAGDGYYFLRQKVSLREIPNEKQTGKTFQMVFLANYRITLPVSTEPEWLKPWFRLRDLPTAAVRGWHASQGARIGFVSAT